MKDVSNVYFLMLTMVNNFINNVIYKKLVSLFLLIILFIFNTIKSPPTYGKLYFSSDPIVIIMQHNVFLTFFLFVILISESFENIETIVCIVLGTSELKLFTSV